MNNKYSILYVDDEESNLRTFRNLLRRDYTILIARSGAEGLKMLEDNQVDLVITDQRMPEMTGVEFLQKVLNKYPEPNRILLTGFSDFEAIKKAVNEGKIFQYVQKPWELDELKPVIDKAIEAYYLKKENERLQNELLEKNSSLNDFNAKLEEEIGQKNLALEELQLSQKELGKSEKRFRDISYSMADWIWEVDLNGQFTYSSGKVMKILGYEPNELIGKTPFELMSEEIAKQIASEFKESAQQLEAIIDLEVWHIRKDGGKVCLLTNGVPLFNEKNDFIGYRGVNKDITHKKKATEKIKKSEEKFRGLMESSIDAIVIVNDRHEILQINEQCQKLFGYKTDELYKKEIDILISEKLRSAHKKYCGNYKIQPRRMIMGKEMELEALKKDGTTFPVEVSLSPLQTEEGLIISTAIRDITERKKAEQSLKHSGERLSLATQIGSIGVWDWDVKNDILIWDESMYKLYGVEKSDFTSVAETWKKAVHPDDSEIAQNEVDEALKGEKDYDTEFRIVTPEGSIKNIHATAATYFDDEGNPNRMIGVNIDLTKTRKAESKLRRSETRLKDAQTLAKLGNWELNLHTNTLYWSDEIYNIFDIDPSKFNATYEAFIETIHPEDREIVKKAYEEHIKKKKPYDIEHRIQLKDGTIKYVHENCYSEFNGSNEAVKSIGTVQDITEKKLIEIELRRHREELEELIKERTSELKDERDKAQNYLDIAGVIIMVLDENQNIILINKKGAETLGYDNEIELLGLNWYDNFIPENDREKRRFTFNDIFSETISNNTYLENTILTRTGETKLIAWKDTALRDHKNKIIGLLSSGEDITLRRKNEETLQERTKELEMFNKTMMGREVRIIELKEEVNALAKKLNKEIPYSTVWNK